MGQRTYWIAGVVVLAVLGAAWWAVRLPGRPLSVEAVLAAYDADHAPGGVTIHYPFHETVFPPGIAPPEFRWDDGCPESDAWLVRLAFSDGEDGFSDGEDGLTAACSEPEWTPSEAEWERLQKRSQVRPVEVTVLGVRREGKSEILSSGRITFSTSTDQIGAPIFYREVNLPFREAVTDPSKIRWRFGEVCSREPPRVVLEHLPVCGNCHSFSADGKVLGMDVDYANDRGSYAILPVAEEMVLDPAKIITWSDYRREEGETTFGLLSQVSPDGRYVASTVQDGSVFLPRPDLAFSQLFFPIKGIVAIYTRDNGTFRSLPGADDPKYVQTNPAWSPDGQWLVFARSKRYRETGNGLLSPQECEVFLEGRETFLFDLYRVPFNGGKGGKAEPLPGASQNGMSNYFPRYSPDGRWIVFCKAKTFMLLQPDSELYILPSGGGEPRRLRCNTGRMNSWHSWSPDGKWMVFSSKAFSPYTQLFLTHIDDAGNSRPPVLLAHFTAPDRAANIPEFVRAAPGAIGKITERYINDHNFVRQAQTNAQFEDFARSEAACRKALVLNPKNARAACNLATLLSAKGRAAEAVDFYQQALTLDPNLFEAHLALGLQSMDANRLDEAMEHLMAAVRLRPEHGAARYYLGFMLQRQGKFAEALSHYAGVLKTNPDSASALAQAALILATCPQRELRNPAEALRMAKRACELSQFNDPEYLATLGHIYAATGHRPEAIMAARRAAEVARKSGREDLARRVEQDFQP